MSGVNLPDPEYFTLSELAGRWGYDPQRLLRHGLRPAFRLGRGSAGGMDVVTDISLNLWDRRVFAEVAGRPVENEWIYLIPFPSAIEPPLSPSQNWPALSTNKPGEHRSPLQVTRMALFDGTPVSVYLEQKTPWTSSSDTALVYLVDPASAFIVPAEEVNRFQEQFDSNSEGAEEHHPVEDGTLAPSGKGALQDAALEQVVRDLGYEPHTVPKGSPGKKGVRAEAWGQLEGHHLFPTREVFRHAWKRMKHNAKHRR